MKADRLYITDLGALSLQTAHLRRRVSRFKIIEGIGGGSVSEVSPPVVAGTYLPGCMLEGGMK